MTMTTAAQVPTATEGPQGFDIASMMDRDGRLAYDPGLAHTAGCASAITYTDGEAGILRYRGYPIEQLAERSSFLEVAYLLIHGELPNATELDAFTNDIARHRMLREEMRRFFDGFPRDAHPMAVLASATSALSTFYQDSLEPNDPAQVEMSTIRLLAKLPTIAAYAYKTSIGQPLLYPDATRGYVEDFLRLTFGVPIVSYTEDPECAQVLDMLFVLHADHEQNCSTSAVRLVGSSRADLFSSVSAGVDALFGPLHGGANQAVMGMLQRIHAEGGDVDRFVGAVKDRTNSNRLMGFGHRVYRSYDPRASIVKRAAQRLLTTASERDPLLDIALRLEETALADPYFIERKLYPNVDFYSGLIYRAMGFPTRMFTVLFALGRLPGWIAQWREMVTDPSTRIGRPRQIYVGPPARDYIPLSRR